MISGNGTKQLIHGRKKQITVVSEYMEQPDFPSGAKGKSGCSIYSDTTVICFLRPCISCLVPFPEIIEQKANYGGVGVYGAAGFSIGSKGYIGTGNNSSMLLKKIFGNMIRLPTHGRKKRITVA